MTDKNADQARYAEVISRAASFFGFIPPELRPQTVEPPPDTPHHLMTVTEYVGPEEPAPRPVRRGPEALVAIYQGLTVAYCPRSGCTNVELIFDEPPVRTPGWVPPQEIYRPRKDAARPEVFRCSSCHHVAPLEWPDDYEAVARELERRPVPQNRNWYPRGHPWAVRSGVPDGQSVRELREEFAAHRGDD